jgi:hypothetical protein
MREFYNRSMFFRRAIPKQPTFQDRLDAAKAAGFTLTAMDGGRTRVSRDTVAVVLEDASGVPRVVERAGVIMGNEIGALVDGGFQKFFQTPSGRRKPALAGDLKAIHEFQEDLREALGLESLYNESLGTVSTYYQYDRLKDRDRGVPKRAWE